MKKSLLLILALALPAAAGTFKWRETLFSEVRDSSVQCAMTLEQTGDDVARAVSVDWEFRGERKSSRTWLEAPPGSVLHTETAIFARPAARGWYPILARLNYADANGYPASAVMFHLQAVDTPMPLRFLVAPLAMTFEFADSAPLKVRYGGEDSIEVAIRIAAPREFRVVEPAPGTMLKFSPGEERTIPVRIEAAGALPGAKTTAYVLLEGDSGGVHEAGIGMINLNLVAPVETGFAAKGTALAVLAVCVILLLVPIVRRRKNPEPR